MLYCLINKLALIAANLSSIKKTPEILTLQSHLYRGISDPPLNSYSCYRLSHSFDTGILSYIEHFMCMSSPQPDHKSFKGKALYFTTLLCVDGTNLEFHCNVHNIQTLSNFTVCNAWQIIKVCLGNVTLWT